MAEALQHDQTALISRISTTGTTDNEPVPDTARSGRANAIVAQPRWYNKSVRSVDLRQTGDGVARDLQKLRQRAFAGRVIRAPGQPLRAGRLGELRRTSRLTRPMRYLRIADIATIAQSEELVRLPMEVRKQRTKPEQ